MKCSVSLLVLLAACHSDQAHLDGVVRGHRHTAESSSIHMLCPNPADLLTCIPTLSTDPERHELVVRVGEVDEVLAVAPELYQAVRDGDRVQVTYRTGGCGGVSVSGRVETRR